MPGTRELVVAGTPYIVAYCVKNNRVEVLFVQHGARLWPDDI
ncbi:type II toxin-antitoxin system RelE/ParE family toxin [Neorhizobium sp. NPDC001467]